MPIEFNCTCGRRLRVAEEHAGRRVKCPGCTTIANVPLPEPRFEVVEEAAEPQFEVVEESAGRPAKKARVWDDDDDAASGYTVAKKQRSEDEEERPRPKRLPNFRQGSGRDEDDDEEPRRKKRKKRRPPERRETSSHGFEGGIINSGVGGGLAAMVIAVVWLVVGLAFGWLFYYPPVLFVVGLIAFIKGLASRE